MLSILVNAYACSPNMGSEPGMAWNWCIHLAKHCKLYIITEGEFKDQIEEALRILPQGKNMHFFYNPVSDKIRKMCWNQGDWRFYKYYKEWQWKTYEMAISIIKEYQIDIIHQLNMIGFREPGYLWKIKDKKFVWGPIGGLKQFPVSYLHGAGIKMNIFNRLKNIINIVQLKYDKRINNAFSRADILISSIPDSYTAIKQYKHLESTIIPETGCFLTNNTNLIINKSNNKGLKLLWVGKFDFRKRLDIALKTIANLKQYTDIELSICGSGNLQQIIFYHQMAKELDIEKQIKWHGNLSNQDVIKIMYDADLFFFTSVSEDTSTVVLEAISCNLPVLCFDACGFGFVINDKVGIKIPLTNPNQSIKDFTNKIINIYNNKEVLNILSENCQQRQLELSWDNKIEQLIKLYKLQ